MARKEILSLEKEGYFCFSNIIIKLSSIFPEQCTFVQQSEECPYCCSVQSSVTYSAHRPFRVRNALIWAVILTVLWVLYIVTIFIRLPTVSFATSSLRFQDNSRYSIYYEPLSRFALLPRTTNSFCSVELACEITGSHPSWLLLEAAHEGTGPPTKIIWNRRTLYEKHRICWQHKGI